MRRENNQDYMVKPICAPVRGPLNQVQKFRPFDSFVSSLEAMILHGVGCRTFRPNARVQDLEDVIQMNSTARHKNKLSRYNLSPRAVHEEGEELLVYDATFSKVFPNIRIQ